MKTLLKITTLASLLLPMAASAQKYVDPEGCLTYSLPSTVITIDVEAVQEKFYAGPYAKYAEKYLGMDVPQKDATVWHLTEITMVPSVEADMDSRYSLYVEKGTIDASFLKLSTSGLVAFGDVAGVNDVTWRFPMNGEGDFSSKGVSSNLTSEATVLYKSDKKNKVTVQQNVIVAKSLEQKAKEAAEMILDIRQKRLQIVVGDTDATYSGEALGAAVAELTRLEDEYMTLFTGYCEYQQQKMSFEVVPEAERETQRYIAFRISEADGLVTADNLSGKPVVLEFVPQEIAPVPALSEKEGKKAPALRCHYRIPAVCNVRLTEGVKVLLQGRVPVYQLGVESTMPVNVILK